MAFPRRVAAFDFGSGFNPTVSVARFDPVASATIESRTAKMIQSSLTRRG